MKDQGMLRRKKGGSPDVVFSPGAVTLVWHGIAWVFTPRGAERLAEEIKEAAVKAELLPIGSCHPCRGKGYIDDFDYPCHHCNATGRLITTSA
jgi:hypothetical protein